MRRSGRTTRAVEEYQTLKKDGKHAVFIAANFIECRRLTELIGNSKDIYSVGHPDFDRDLGEIRGMSHNTNYVFDHFAAECVVDKIEDEIKALRTIQERYRKLALKF